MQTQTEFFWSEVEKWGEEEIDSLLSRGFEPVLTTEGWRWLYISKDNREKDVRQERGILLTQA